MIRPATLDDLDHIAGLGPRFHAMSSWSDVAFDPASLAALAANLIGSPQGVVHVSPRGAVGGILFPLHFNRAVTVAQELFWYDEGPDGEALHAAFEAEARAKGATALMMSCLCDGREPAMRRLLRRRGYEPREVSLWKEV